MLPPLVTIRIASLLRRALPGLTWVLGATLTVAGTLIGCLPAHETPSVPRSPRVHTIDTMVSAMAQDSIVVADQVGISLIETEQWRRYQRLCATATDDELLALVEHESPVVRCYSFRALVRRDHREVMPTLVRYLVDTQLVETISGCIVTRLKVGDYFVQSVVADDLERLALRRADRERLDSHLLHRTDLTLEACRRRLGALGPRPGWYDRVRELALVDSVDLALVPLARYRDPNDIPVVLAALSTSEREPLRNALRAVHAFPHEAFYRRVVDIFDSLRVSAYAGDQTFAWACAALARYPRGEVAELFRATVRGGHSPTDTSSADAVVNAVRLHPNPWFDSVTRGIAYDRETARLVGWDFLALLEATEME